MNTIDVVFSLHQYQQEKCEHLFLLDQWSNRVNLFLDGQFPALMLFNMFEIIINKTTGMQDSML